MTIEFLLTAVVTLYVGYRVYAEHARHHRGVHDDNDNYDVNSNEVQAIVDRKSESVMRYRHHRNSREPMCYGRFVEPAQAIEQTRGSFDQVAVCAEIECDGGSW